MNGPSKTVVFLVSCLLLVVPIAGCLEPSDDDGKKDPYKNYVKFTSTELDGTRAWTIHIFVNAEPEMGTEWLWDDASVVLTGPGGSDRTFLAPTHGDVGDPKKTRAYYDLLDYPPNRGAPYTMVSGDALVVAGVTDDHLSGRIKLKVGDDVVQTLSIPKELGEDVEMSLEGDPPASNLGEDSISWTLALRPDITHPSTFPLFWDVLQAGIIGPDGDFLVDLQPLMERNMSHLYEDPDEDGGVEFRYYDYTFSDISYMDGYIVYDPEHWWYANCMSDEGAGDVVVVLGLTRAHLGGRVVIHKGIDRIAESLPIGPLDDPILNVELGTPVIENNVTNDTMFHNARIEVEELELSNDSLSISWSSARVLVTDREGVVLGNMSVWRSGPGDFCSSFEASADEDIDEGDELLLKGLDLSFRGANLELFISGLSVTNVTFPEDFNITGVRLSTSTKAVDNRTAGDGTVYDITVYTSSKVPYHKTIPWDQVQARLVDRINGTVLIELGPPAPYDGTPDDGPGTYIEMLEDESSHEEWKANVHVLGLDRSFEGSYLELFIGDEMVGWERLPEAFNTSSRPAALNIPSPSVQAVYINQSIYYVVVLNINKIVPSTARAYWENVTIRVLRDNGTVLLPETPVVEDPWEYDTDDTDGIDIGVWFIEVTSGDDKIDAGDALRLTGLTDEFQDGRVQVFYRGEFIGSAVMPTNFP